MPRKKKPETLPKYVHLKKGEWYVGLNFPTERRDAKGQIIYEQFARRCFPETAERAAEVAAFIKASYLEGLEKTIHSAANQTVNEFLEIFTGAKKKSLSRRTFEFYTEQFDWFVKDSEFGKKLLPEIKPLDVQRFYDGLQESGAASPDATRKLHQFLSAAFNQAVLWESLAKNPTKGVILPKKTKSEVEAMTADEARKFIEACRSSGGIVFEFGFETAARPEEYLALRWTDLDLTARTATVRRAVAFGFKGGGYEIKETKTAAAVRTLILSEQLTMRLAEHRRNQLAEIERLKSETKKLACVSGGGKLREKRRAARLEKYRRQMENYKTFNLVFPSSLGSPMSRLNLNRRNFKAILKIANIEPKRFSLYSLRRTAATLLASRINPKELAAFLGHTDVATTMKYYVLITEDSKYKAAAALSSILY